MNINNDVTEYAEALMTMLDRFEKFVVEQIDQLEFKSSAQHPLSGGAATLPVTLGQNCEAQLNQLQADADHLIAAWRELEAEQRQMLAAKSVGQVVGGSPRTKSNGLELKVPGKLISNSGVKTIGQMQSQVENVKDFALAQLQREVRTHRRNN